MAKILIIDDDVSIGNMIETALLKAGHEAWRAYSGTEALFLLERERPDLILLDLMLPGLSGEELLAEVFAKFRVHRGQCDRWALTTR